MKINIIEVQKNAWELIQMLKQTLYQIEPEAYTQPLKPCKYN